jgi:D-xylose transport system substrate-binding protein
MESHWDDRNVRQKFSTRYPGNPIGRGEGAKPWARKGLAASLSLALCLTAAACSSSSAGTSAPASGSSSSAAGSVSISVNQFDRTLSAMSTLKPLAAAGKGNVAVILPDTVTSARYTEFDAPYLTQALTDAGLSSSQFSVQNAQGDDTTELSDAQTAITKGASVLIMDPLDSGVGAQIESYAKSHGVAVIDYDRLTLGGSRQYYVSFNNVLVGTKIGQGFVSCASAWHVAKPNVLVMKGDPTDNNATLFAQGYDAVLQPHFSNGSYVKVGNAAGTWDPPTALSEFQQQFTAHKNINSALTPNDENAAPIIHYLQTQDVKPRSFPVTGQDATTIGLQNILAGYQCGTVYKPIYLEAQGAVALAMYLRAGKTPPSTLVNGTTKDSASGSSVPSVLLTPKWVTTSNMASTVVADQFVKTSQLCAGNFAAACKAAGIS